MFDQREALTAVLEFGDSVLDVWPMLRDSAGWA
jgi:hypothetical protein